MCGILGFSGKGPVRKIISRGLKALEYRGYDSCGYAFLSEGVVCVNKKTGKGGTDELVSEIPEYSDRRICVISHTRWATHGKVCLENAHPHRDCKNEIALVHNGIIENYARLKKELEQKGHIFSSDTDTEVIAHLFEEEAKKMPFRKAVLKSLNKLDGTFALLVLRKGCSEIIGARKGSPLFAGVKGKDFFISSDINSIVNYTDEIMFLEDGDMFAIGDEMEILDFVKKESVKRSFSRIKSGVQSTAMGNFESYMQKEIFEQPAALVSTFNSLCKELARYMEIVDTVPGRITIVGCGSSWHAGLIGEYMMEKLLRIPVEVEYASEFRYRNPVFLPDDLVVSISQSGETADTLGAVKEAKKKAKLLSICNVHNSSIPGESNYALYTQAGPEIGVASTKAFTAQIAALYFLNLLLALKMGLIKEYSLEKKIEEFSATAKKIRCIFSMLPDMEKIADKLKDKSNALFLGRGIHFPVALEGALKMKEVSYIHAEGYPAAEMKHGPIALIDENMPVVFISVRDRFSMKVISNMREVKARGGCIITVSDYIDDDILNISDEIINIPEAENEYLKPLLTVIPLQLLAYLTALKRDCDVDKPRNLAKCVTVE
ncbi:MAG: glutamine--fructose-6-phosphate transaminase (isomerizing) [Candidatus Omnitrophica bacterium]|nr:glutamine--fructose-6-phosphate transaminase (isomerizing) [Candidatus Omnitrophota bacterium]